MRRRTTYSYDTGFVLPTTFSFLRVFYQLYTVS
jgi:hypothetical protein